MSPTSIISSEDNSVGALAYHEPGAALRFWLAERLELQLDDMVSEWIHQTRTHDEVTSARKLKTSQISDHVPELLHELVDSLRVRPLQPGEHSAAPELTSLRHADERWAQGYDLPEIFRELFLLREHVMNKALKLLRPFSLNDEVIALKEEISEFFFMVESRSLLRYVEEQKVQTERSHLALEAAHQSLEETNRRRVQLIRMVSHEVRNLLSALKLGIQCGFSEENESERRQSEEICLRSVDEMNALQTQLMDYSLVISSAPEKGISKPAAQVEEKSTAELLEEIRLTWMPLVVKAGLEFQAAAQPGKICCALRPLRQILANLFTNAIKYTPQGYVKVNIEHSSNGSEWVISVSDSGLGIGQEHLGELFGEFHRIAHNENIPGAGLGLFIAQHSAQELGGFLKVHSVLGRGSVFCLHLPVSTHKK